MSHERTKPGETRPACRVWKGLAHLPICCLAPQCLVSGGAQALRSQIAICQHRWSRGCFPSDSLPALPHQLSSPKPPFCPPRRLANQKVRTVCLQVFYQKTGLEAGLALCRAPRAAALLPAWPSPSALLPGLPHRQGHLIAAVS